MSNKDEGKTSFLQVLCAIKKQTKSVKKKKKRVADKGSSATSVGKLATIIMKHKKEKGKEKSKKKVGGSRASSILTTMQRHSHHHQHQQHSSCASSAALLDQAALQSAYRWEKLSPAEFEQLQDLAACKIYILFNSFNVLGFDYFALALGEEKDPFTFRHFGRFYANMSKYRLMIPSLFLF